MILGNIIGESLKDDKKVWSAAIKTFTTGMKGFKKVGVGGFEALKLSSKGFIETLWSGLSVVSKFAIGIGAVVAVGAILYKIYDDLNTSTEEYREELKKIKSEASEIESELKSLNDELEVTQDRLTELSGKDTLTFTEKEEYDNLVKQNNELQRKIDLLELEQKTKNADKNKTFVDTMNSDTQDNDEYYTYTNPETGEEYVYEGSYYWKTAFAGDDATYYNRATEEDYINKQFEKRKEKILKLAEVENQLLKDQDNEELKREKERLETQINDINTYLQSKSTQWTADSEGISYISDPTDENYESTNKWLDFIADFQDKMAIAMGGENAKTNAFNRLVDNWYFDETVQSLQDFGKEGKVTAEMLENPAYDEFIDKLVEIGFIDSADNLEDIALAFNNIADAANKAANNTNTVKTNIQVLSGVESLSKGLDQLGEIYKDVLDGKEFDYSSILNNEDFKEEFGDYTEEYENFIETISNSPNDIKACQDAFNKLASAYIYGSDALNGLTEENEKAVIQMLKQMNIANAEEIIAERKKIAQLLSDYETYVIEKGDADLEYLKTLTGNDTELIKALTETYSTDYNNWIDLLKKKSEAYNTFVTAIKGSQNTMLSSAVVPDASKAKTIVENYEKYGAKGASISMPTFGMPGLYNPNANNKYAQYTAAEYEAAKKWIELEEQTNALKESFNINLSTVTPNFEEFSYTNGDLAQTYDWIETLISRIQRSITKLGKTVSATYKSWTDRNKALKTSISEIANEYNKQNEAATYYKNKANSVGLDETYAKKVREGDMSVQEGVTDEALKEKIEKYREYWEKYLGAEDAAIDAQSELVAKYQEQFDLITGEFDAKMGVLEHQANMINGYIDQAEAKGHFASEKYYDKLIALEKGNMAYLEEQRDKLQSSFNEMMASGDVAMYSQQWYEMSAQILEVDEAIQECNASITESENKINELRWAVFDKAQEMISEIHDEKEFLLQLIEEDDLFDDNGNWTEYADAKAGLHAADYNTYMAQANDYANAIKELDETYEDKNSQIYLDRKKELIAAQREMILAAQDEKQAMIDLASNGYDVMLEALNELIEKEKEAMDEFKSLYDYQNSISEKTKNINSLEKKLDAYKGDDSEEAQSVIQQTTVQLEEARKDLEQTEMDKNIEDRKQLLDKLADDTQEWVDARLDDTNGLLEDILNSVNGDTDSIKATLDGLAEGVGTSLSTEMSAIFGEGSLVSTVSQTLTDIKGFVEKLVTDADKKADENVKNTEDKDDKQPSGTGSGTGNVGGNTGSGQKPTTSSTPTTSKNEDTSKKKWGWWFVPQNWNGNNKLLNTETSIEDRLRSLDYAFDMANRAKYFEAMGLGKASNYRGTYEQNVAMLKEMKKHKGFKVGSRRIPKNQNAWTQENGQELIYRSSDGAILTPLGRGDAVFTADMTQRLWDIAKTPDIFSHLTTTTLPKGIVSNGMNNNVQNDVVMNISLPNVVDVDGFVNELRNNKRFEKVVQSMTIGTINPKGYNSLSKMKL